MRGLERRTLGRTGIEVTRLCLGSLTVGPLQKNLDPAAGGRVIAAALTGGVNFIDTAQYYGNYEYIRTALALYEEAGYDSSKVVIASKSYAYTKEDMRRAVDEARKALDRDVIDIFLLHEQESVLTISGHRAALEYLLEAKSRGIIRAAGLSTHFVEPVRASAAIDEIEVIHPIVNVAGLGIRGGSLADMLEAVDEAARCGKGIYAMKPLGGGNLVGRYPEAMSFVTSIDALHSIAIGMASLEEVAYNLAFFRGDAVGPPPVSSKSLYIDRGCTGCGECVEKCPSGALRLEGGRLSVDRDLCLLCGYCAPVCRQFSIRVV